MDQNRSAASAWVKRTPHAQLNVAIPRNLLLPDEPAIGALSAQLRRTAARSGMTASPRLLFADWRGSDRRGRCGPSPSNSRSQSDHWSQSGRWGHTTCGRTDSGICRRGESWSNPGRSRRSNWCVGPGCRGRRADTRLDHRWLVELAERHAVHDELPVLVQPLVIGRLTGSSLSASLRRPLSCVGYDRARRATALPWGSCNR